MTVPLSVGGLEERAEIQTSKRDFAEMKTCTADRCEEKSRQAKKRKRSLKREESKLAKSSSSGGGAISDTQNYARS